jgi:CheY-like chemotaxis protein
MARVLVVDDETQIRESLQMLLEDAGHTVTTAARGAEALDTLRAAPESEVVLLDLLMPEMDGLGVLRAVTADPQLAERHGYILMTADSDRLLSAAAHVLAALPVTVVRKPFDIDDVLETVAAVAERLDGHHGRGASDGQA